MGKKKQRPAPETAALPPGGVETHAHLDLDAFADDFEEVLDRARRCGVSRFGQVFLGPQAYSLNKAAFDDKDDVFTLLGMHPHDATKVDEACLADMERAFRSDDKLKAFGEIGLDFYYDKSPRDVQETAFREQLKLAKELDLPVVIHSRDALAETLAVLDDEGFEDRPVLWHCFGLGPDAARELLTRNIVISLPGPVTYAKNEPLREAAAMIPADRLTLETDCPFLSPEPWRGKRCEPAYLVFTAAGVAEVRGEAVEDVWRSCARTAMRFFGLDAE